MDWQPGQLRVLEHMQAARQERNVLGMFRVFLSAEFKSTTKNVLQNKSCRKALLPNK
jgi:hypothetical protein